MKIPFPKTRGMLRREAAGWLARLQSAYDSDVQRRFERWRDSDPTHAAAFERVRRSYDQAGLLRQSSLAAADFRDAPRSARAWQPRAGPALAAAALLVALVPIGLVIVGNGSLGGTDALMLMTSVGEIKHVELPDGSRVTLDTSTRIDLEIGRSRRDAHLRYGRARFQVAPSSLPFVVDTRNAIVTAKSGIIDVQESARRDLIHVLSGMAQVRGSAGGQPSATLASGEIASVARGGPEHIATLPPASDWTHGMLQFDGTPLADAVALANRYSQRHIILTGDLGSLRVSGAFRAGDTARLAKALAAAFHLSLDQRSNGDLVLSRSGSAPASK